MNLMSKYRKKPVVIESMQYSRDNLFEVLRFLGDADQGVGEADRVLIGTLEGTMTASVGDYIIKGVAGEFYPCKPDIFEATYEAVDD